MDTTSRLLVRCSSCPWVRLIKFGRSTRFSFLDEEHRGPGRDIWTVTTACRDCLGGKVVQDPNLVPIDTILQEASIDFHIFALDCW